MEDFISKNYAYINLLRLRNLKMCFGQWKHPNDDSTEISVDLFRSKLCKDHVFEFHLTANNKTEFCVHVTLTWCVT